MTTTAQVVYLGVYTVGEVPPPISYSFLDSDGNALDTDAFAADDATFTYRRSRSTTETERAAVLAPATGVVTWTPVAADFATPGVFYGKFFIDNGTNAHASVLLVWETRSLT